MARCSFAEKNIVKAAGFRWDPDRRQWWTAKADAAAKFADPDAAAKIQQQIAEVATKKQEAIVASRAADADVDLPCPPGLAYLPYQRAGIATALARNNILFGDEMGLGKTIQAIGIINADETLRTILVVCPASLRLNWAREIRKWSVRPLTIVLATGSSIPRGYNVVIINYDILSKHEQTLRAIEWDLVIVDEAHFLKNQKAKRTIALLGKDAYKQDPGVPPVTARRRIMLTGTPIPNRPIEGFPLFHWLAPDEFRSFWGYAKRYCAAEQNAYGWDLTGASNLPELQDKLRGSIMIRRLKSDVLTELPAKRRQIIEFPANEASGAVQAEHSAWERHEETIAKLRAAAELAKASDNPDDYADAVANLTRAARAAFDEMSKLRHQTAVAKIPYVIEHIRDTIESETKCVVFAHHHDMIKALAKEFGDAAVTLFGDDAMAARQASVDRFQSDPECKVFIGGILAAGVGITLTSASHVIFAELDWVPGNVTQAEDRCHRIGQKDMVLVQHLVLEGSLDARMAEILVQKQEVIAAALDTEREIEPVVVPTRETAATERTTRQEVAKEAILLTDETIEAIQQALKILAGYDSDHARHLNGMGFSKIDVWIGHSLADAYHLSAKQAVLGQKLVNKYRRQLPEDLVALAKGQGVS